MKRRGWRGWLIPCAALAAAGCDSREAVEARVSDGPSAVPVRTAHAERATLTRSAAVSGTVEPIRRVFVNAQISGEVVDVRVREGDRVAPGAFLARLDDRQLRAELSAAQAAFEVAEATLRRSERLREGQIVTEAEFERDRSAFAAARARLEQVRTQLEFATIRAAAAGVVTQRSVEVGNVVSPQTRLFAVDDLSTLVVRAGVSELDVVHLREGLEVPLSLDAHPGVELAGRVRRIFPTADPATRLVPVEVELSDAAAALARPGFLARISFPLERREGVVTVPAASVLTRAGGEVVFRVEEGQVRLIPVVTGLTSAERVEIVEPLGPGDEVVVSGQAGLRDGLAVRVVAEPDVDAALESSPAPEEGR